jgi:hypothetical protein
MMDYNTHKEFHKMKMKRERMDEPHPRRQLGGAC